MKFPTPLKSSILPQIPKFWKLFLISLKSNKENFIFVLKFKDFSTSFLQLCKQIFYLNSCYINYYKFFTFKVESFHRHKKNSNSSKTFLSFALFPAKQKYFLRKWNSHRKIGFFLDLNSLFLSQAASIFIVSSEIKFEIFRLETFFLVD